LVVLPREDVRDGRRRLAARLGVLEEDAERPPVAWKLFDVDEFEPLCAEDRADRLE